jgi:hypothetical protein
LCVISVMEIPPHAVRARKRAVINLATLKSDGFGEKLVFRHFCS